MLTEYVQIDNKIETVDIANRSNMYTEIQMDRKIETVDIATRTFNGLEDLKLWILLQ